jgi:hypothetical protein
MLAAARSTAKILVEHLADVKGLHLSHLRII